MRRGIKFSCTAASGADEMKAKQNKKNNKGAERYKGGGGGCRWLQGGAWEVEEGERKTWKIIRRNKNGSGGRGEWTMPQMAEIKNP